MLDLQAGPRKEALPFAGGAGAAMRGVTPFLDGIVEGVQLWIIGRHAIDEQEEAARLEDARDLLHRPGNIGEVMGGDATGDAVKAGIQEGQRLRVRELEDGVGDALREEKCASFFQHARRQICDCYFCYIWGDGACGMAAAGGDIERMLMTLPLANLDQSLEVVAGTVSGTGNVAFRCAAELILNLGFLFVAALG